MKKIVVVDDDPCMRDLISEILSPRYQVLTAADGVEGLQVIERESPDLVVLDLLMPRMHGFEVCQRLRRHERLKNVKILISSSKSYAHDVKTATAGAGADLFVIKPFDIATFTSQVDKLLGVSRTPLTLRFWGTRGSLPSPGPRTQRYGGNTPCVELRAGHQLLIVDAGSGIRELGGSLMEEFKGKPITGHLFIGHTHWDHIQGFPFFTPLYLPQNRFTVYGAHGTTQGFSEVLAGQMNPTYFPVAMKEMGSRLEVVELAEPLTLGEVKVSIHYLNHPGITIGFRFETKDWTVSYISDHEPYGRLNERGEFSDREDAAVARFVEGSDLLVCEAQYTDEEYKYKRSWGHSTFSDVLELAARARAKRLALFHHDPTHTDEQMDRHVADCQAYLQKHGHALECFGAQEGMSLTL